LRLPNKSQALFISITFAGLLAGAAIFFIQALRSIGVQQDIHYPESAVVFGVINRWRGQPLYHDFHQAPFAVTGYTPVYYFLSAGVAKLFARSVHAVYALSRLVSFIATILTALTASLIVKREGGGKTAQFATALLFLSSSILLPWGFMARVDALMLLFTVGGLYLFQRFKGTTWQYLSIVAFVLALFTKQSALAAPAAVFGVLMLERRWRQAFIFATVLVLVCVICFAVFNQMTGGLMALNVIGSLDAPMRLRSIYEIFSNSSIGLLAPIMFAIFGIIAARGRARVALLILYLIGSIALAAVTSGKLGSDRNYYLDTLLAASMLGGIGIEWLSTFSGRGWLKAAIGTIIVILIIIPDLNQKYATANTDYFVSENNDSTIDYLRNTPGDILTQDSNIPLRLEKPVFVTDSYHLSVLEACHKWQPDPLIQLIEQKHFQAIVLPFDVQAGERPSWTIYQGLPIWDSRILDAIAQNYQVTETLGTYHIYSRR